MTIWTKGAVLAAALVLVGATTIGLSQAQNSPIDQRRALMKANGQAMQAMKAVVDAKGDAKAMAAHAATVAKGLGDAGKLFPAGTDKPVGKDPGQTQALPEIWANMADFNALTKASADAALKLEASAKTGDIAKASADFGDLGKSCGACHNKYRVKQQ
jgi:cytochrome c556